MLRRLFRFARGVVFFPLSAAFANEAFQFLVSNSAFYEGNWVIYGFAAYAVVYILFYIISAGRKVLFIQVLEHEVIHALTAIFLFWRDIKELQAKPEEGEVTVEGGPNVVITLAPYCLPLLTIPLVMVRVFIAPSVMATMVNFSIGFTFAFHLLALLREFNRKQKDIKQAGYLLSIDAVCLMNSIIVVVIVCVVSGNLSSVWSYLLDSGARTQEYYRFSIQSLRMLDEALPALWKAVLAIVCKNC
jgi:hypothetical protein